MKPDNYGKNNVSAQDRSAQENSWLTPVGFKLKHRMVDMTFIV